ncbi:MAG: patatin-like phospholipase family protein [Ruminococcus sp.]|nr:patatin-like phospholipase family protein [Ruminococcus sp.]
MQNSDRKDKTGFAFSGGGLQGIAHVGAIKALYELGIKPDFVSGTSSGSAMAALVAMGCDAEDMKHFAKKYWKDLVKFRPSSILQSIVALKFGKKNPGDGLMDGVIVEAMIRSVMKEKGIKGFHDLPVNLTVCTNDTITTDEVIITTYDEGLEKLGNEYIQYLTDVPLEIAVRASMSFPGLFTTCNYKQYNFIDGGSKDNLPVKVLKDMGVGKVLALAFDIMDYTPQTGIDGTMNVVWRALDLYSINGTRKSMEMADYCVQIKNENTAIFAMDNIDETIEEGYQCVMKHKDEILKIFKNQT